MGFQTSQIEIATFLFYFITSPAPIRDIVPICWCFLIMPPPLTNIFCDIFRIFQLFKKDSKQELDG